LINHFLTHLTLNLFFYIKIVKKRKWTWYENTCYP